MLLPLEEEEDGEDELLVGVFKFPIVIFAMAVVVVVYVYVYVYIYMYVSSLLFYLCIVLSHIYICNMYAVYLKIITIDYYIYTNEDIG